MLINEDKNTMLNNSVMSKESLFVETQFSKIKVELTVCASLQIADFQ